MEQDKILAYCKSKLPEYMVPSKIIEIDKIPVNSNGKIDKIKLKNMYLKNNISKKNDVEEVICDYCLKSLKEDKKLDGPGFIKIIDHNLEDKLICSICLKGF